SRNAPTVATFSGSLICSASTPRSSRKRANSNNLIMPPPISTPSMQQFRKGQKTHRVTGGDRFARRHLDQPVAPHRRSQHARTLVGKQVEPARAIDAHAQILAPHIGLRPVEI